MNRTCSPITSFLASPDALLIVYHTFAIIGTPLHIIAFYCIIKKSTAKMRDVRGVLLQLHTFTMTFDTIANVLCAPFVALPCLMGWAMGVLSWFDVPIAFQTYISLASGTQIGASTLLLFEYRFFTVVPVSATWKKWRIPFHVLNFFLHLAHLAPQFLFLVPKDQKASLATCPYFPCGMDISNNAISLAENIWYNGTSIFLLLSIDFPSIFYCSVSLNLFVKRQKNRSAKTMALQRKLQRALILQCLIPAVWLGVPSSLIVLSALANVYIPLLTNFVTLVLGSHGITATTTLLLAHEPYRVFLFGWTKHIKFLDSRRINKDESVNVPSVVQPIRPMAWTSESIRRGTNVFIKNQ